MSIGRHEYPHFSPPAPSFFRPTLHFPSSSSETDSTRSPYRTTRTRRPQDVRETNRHSRSHHESISPDTESNDCEHFDSRTGSDKLATVSRPLVNRSFNLIYRKRPTEIGNSTFATRFERRRRRKQRFTSSRRCRLLCRESFETSRSTIR